MPLDYLDFELEIGQPTGQAYPIAVLSSPAGNARTVMQWPLGELALENRLKDVQIALLSAGGGRRTLLTPAEQAVQRFGAELFDLLFSGEVRNRYDVSQLEAHHQGKGLRVKLRIQPPALAVLPWEFLHDPRRGEYICLSQQTPLVRYLELPQTIRPLAVTPPLRILAMIASPTDVPPLDVETERQRLDQALAPLQEAGLVELHWLAGQSWRDLQRALRREQWHIFHFTGHGDFDTLREEGLIVLANAAGRPERFSAGDLGRLLADHRSLRLAVLNACLGAQGSTRDLFSSTAATLVRRGLPAVVAMQYTITDAAAIEFTQTFYESLADGLPVDAAMSEARKAISFAVANTLEWGTPVLYSRAPDGQLFVVEAITSARQAGTPEVKPQSPEQTEQVTGEQSPQVTPPSGSRNTQHATRPPHSPLAFDWVHIPAGEFLMGSDKSKDKDAFNSELPQFRLHLPDYYIARTPVTNVQYKQFVEATGHQPPAQWSGGQIPKGKETHPVVYIRWPDAVAFCAWANVRLPTEAEWEKAARGDGGRIYPWGNEAPDATRCNFNNNVKDTTPVGDYPKGASLYGCLDMAGNVWEWTSTKWLGNYEDYATKVDNSLEGGGSRVVRGGSFVGYRGVVRCAARNYNVYWFYSVGVRVAWSSGS